MPSDERKHVGPDPAKPLKHDTGRGIILRIIRGGTPVMDPDQHPVDPPFDGSVVIAPPLIVAGWCTSVPPGAELPSGPEMGPPRRGSRVPRFLEWFHGQGDYVHGYPGNRGRSERALGRDALVKKVGTLSRMRQKSRGGSLRPHGRGPPSVGGGPRRAVNGSAGMSTGGIHG